jgi:hypothetical protein
MADHQYDPDSDSLSFPDDTVVGIVDDPDAAEKVVADLVAAGIAEDEISVLCCDSGVRRLDPSGERHGTLGRLKRLVQTFGDTEKEYVRKQADELRAGNYLVAAPADEDERDAVAGVLNRHGGRFINHYGNWTVTRLSK